MHLLRADSPPIPDLPLCYPCRRCGRRATWRYVDAAVLETGLPIVTYWCGLHVLPHGAGVTIGRRRYEHCLEGFPALSLIAAPVSERGGP